MNRPRNRQTRQPRNDQRNSPRQHPPPQTNVNLPTTLQVVPGAAVSIVMKADQTTGREVEGTVRDLLSRGNHPRGIKVRLQDGRIGRVQRMANGSSVGTDLKSNDEAERPPEGPPLRSLADFLPTSNSDNVVSPRESLATTFTSDSIKCPICGSFEGDEAAVSHHVEEHFR